MVLLVLIYFTTVICTLPAATIGDKEANGDIKAHGGLEIRSHRESEVRDLYTGPAGVGVDHSEQGLYQHIESGNGQNDPVVDSIKTSDTEIDRNTSLIYGDDRDTTVQQETVVTDEEVEPVVDEELQQDLPDLWTDTGPFLTSILKSTHIRPSDPAPVSFDISVGSPDSPLSEAGDGVDLCPPPVVPVTPALCGAPACLTHTHCAHPRDPHTACCFNGCVHTCLSPLDAPAVIDWLEDTSLILPMLDEAPGVPRFPVQFEGSSSIAYAQGGGEAVHLQGGCTITTQQYNQLKDFMTRMTTIQDCSCTDGEVVCAVKPYKAEDE